MVAYNNKKYYIDIVETKPSSAISIIETDCEVDFAPPLDYKEPERPKPTAPPSADRSKYNKLNKPLMKTPTIRIVQNLWTIEEKLENVDFFNTGRD